jgi:hypothetical protein
MKKIFIGIMTLVYMVVSSGIAMEIHYCMGKQAGVEFYGKESDRCSKCGMKDKKGCCSDEHKFYKLSDSHKNVTNDIKFTTGDVAVVTEYPSFDWQLPVAATAIAATNYSPPGDTGPSLNVLHCVFRI